MIGSWVWLAVALVVVPTRRRRAGRGEPGRAAPGPDREAPGPGRQLPESRGAPWTAATRPAAVALVTAAAAGLATLAAVGGPLGALAAGPVALTGYATARWAARRAPPVRADRALALVLDLCAAALRGGCPLADALSVAAPAGQPALRDALQRVAGLLRLGATTEQAWAGLPLGSPLAPVVPVAIRSASSGLRLADSFERLAEEIRAEVGTAAAARAHRAGIWALAPLGACFLPAFVCLGIVPVVVGVARSTTAVLP